MRNNNHLYLFTSSSLVRTSRGSVFPQPPPKKHVAQIAGRLNLTPHHPPPFSLHNVPTHCWAAEIISLFRNLADPSSYASTEA